MNIILLADAGSAHTIKWAKALALEGYNILIFSLSGYNTIEYADYPNINIYTAKIRNKLFKLENGAAFKIVYLKALFALNKVISEFRPDLLHSHYATSYGLLGSLTRFHPFIISLWGSDVYDFPQRSFIHRKILMNNLNKADLILSTSKIMAVEAKKYCKKEISITPFGIDTNQFRPKKVISIFAENDIVIGTVKSLEKNYGIEFLIRAFKTLRDKHPHLPLKLLIVGSGKEEERLKSLVRNSNISADTVFTGYINQDKIPLYHNMLTIAVYLSMKESFGVAAIESSACEKAVIVSDAYGFRETVKNGVTGIIVHYDDLNEIVEAIELLIFNSELRNTLGKNGRKKVIIDFNWATNVKEILNIYENTVKNN